MYWSILLMLRFSWMIRYLTIHVDVNFSSSSLFFFFLVVVVPNTACSAFCLWCTTRSSILLFRCMWLLHHNFDIPAGSPSRGGDVAVHVFDTQRPNLPTPFYSLLVSISVCMALSTEFHSIDSTDSSSLSHSVLPVLFMPYWSFQLYISSWKSPSAPDTILRGWLGLKHQLTN